MGSPENILRCIAALMAILIGTVAALGIVIYMQSRGIDAYMAKVDALIGEVGYFAAAQDRQNQTLTAWTNVWRMRQEHDAGSRLKEKQEKQAKKTKTKSVE